MQQDQDQRDDKTEVTMEPKAASTPEPFAGEHCFCQDKLYQLSPFQLGHCGIVGSRVPAKPLRFELWGAREVLSLLPIHALAL